MIRPRRMKHIELTVLSRDIDAVIEYLGRKAVLHFTEEDAEPGSLESSRPAHSVDEASYKHIKENLEKLQTASTVLGVDLPREPEEDSALPGEAEEALTAKIFQSVESLSSRENEQAQERKKVEETLNEARSFSKLNAPFSDLDQLSYLTLRVGRLDPRFHDEIRDSLADRAVIIPLGAGDDRVLAAASRKGRFALDSELKKYSFSPISVPEGYQGVPAELLSSLEDRLKKVETIIEDTAREKEALRGELGPALKRLASSYLMASTVEQLKTKLIATRSIYLISGWVPQDIILNVVEALQTITEKRIAIRTFNPDERAPVRDGREKVPVSLEHGSFVKGFEGVVFSYGAPLYGTIDPTPFVAVFFTILFGIMFGDLGQGFVLLMLGLLTGKKGPAFLARFRSYSSPLIAVGAASMVMGLLTGEVFTNEELLVAPTRAITGLITGNPVDHILIIMPLAEKGGSVVKLFYFFGFTISVGVILNSVGLLVNIVNLCIMKKYEGAFFSKTGAAGLFLFWYAVSIAVRCLLGGRFEWFDFIGLLFPVACIFFGPLIWRIAARKRPVLEHGFMVFVMEGFVEVLETASTYISNTVSFLRVGAFALSHAVLSYIVFRFSEEIAHLEAGPVGPLAALLIMVFGNAVIIVLEGMIVAIQVVRLQYYEFFSKFFIETGVRFSPFRFRKGIH